MKNKGNLLTHYRGDTKRIYDYLRERKVASTKEIVTTLQINTKKVWEIIDRLEDEGRIRETRRRRYTGDKGRICEYLRKKRIASTSEIVFALNILPKRVWEITNELEAEGRIFS